MNGNPADGGSVTRLTATACFRYPAFMPLKESEAIVLRTYPLRESDLLVTLFTRLEGKVRGVARAAKKSRRGFGGSLEPLTYVKVGHDDRERHELARLYSLEVLESPPPPPRHAPPPVSLRPPSH